MVASKLPFKKIDYIVGFRFPELKLLIDLGISELKLLIDLGISECPKVFQNPFKIFF